MSKTNVCSIKECESSSDIFFCPNRFSGYEMDIINFSIDVANNYLKGISKLSASGVCHWIICWIMSFFWNMM